MSSRRAQCMALGASLLALVWLAFSNLSGSPSLPDHRLYGWWRCALVSADLFMGAAYYGIGIDLNLIGIRDPRLAKALGPTSGFVVFAIICGTAHFADAIGYFHPMYAVLTPLYVLAAIAAIIAWRLLRRSLPRLAEVAVELTAEREVSATRQAAVKELTCMVRDLVDAVAPDKRAEFDAILAQYGDHN